MNKDIHALLMLNLFFFKKRNQEGLIIAKSPLNRSTKTVGSCSFWTVMQDVSVKGCDVARLELCGPGKASVQTVSHAIVCYCERPWGLKGAILTQPASTVVICSYAPSPPPNISWLLGMFCPLG